MRISYRETKTVKSNNIGNIFWGLVLSIIFYYLGTHIIESSRDEYRTSQKLLKQGEKDFIEVSKLLPENEGKLIYTYGDLIAKEELFDKDFNIKVKNSLILDVDIEMYQWDENVRTNSQYNDNDTKTVTKEISYEKGWYSRHINSANFNSRYRSFYMNPSQKIQGQHYEQKSLTLNGFNLTHEQVKNNIDELKSLTLPNDLVIPQVFSKNYTIHDDTIFVSKSGKSSLDYPEIGDYKISFKYMPMEKCTLLGLQKGNGVESLIESQNFKIFFLKNNFSTPEEIFKHLNKSFKQTQIFGFVIGVAMLFIVGLVVYAIIATVFNLDVERHRTQCRILLGAMFLTVTIYIINLVTPT